MKLLIESSYFIADRLDQSLNNIKFINQDKIVVGVSFFSLSLEHQRSIIVLVENGLYGSASTILRSLFESYIKGMWFLHCSSQKDIENLQKDKFQVGFGKLIKDVESKVGEGVSKAKNELWNTLNSLTHSGAAQVSRRISNSEIKSNYTDEFLIDTLKLANNYALLSACQIAKISNNSAAQICTLEIAKELELL